MTNPLPGLLALAGVAGVLVTCTLSWWLARRYRARLRELMATAGPAPVAARPPVVAPPGAGAPAPFSLHDLQRAEVRLVLLLAGVSLLVSFSSATIWTLLSFAGEPLRPARLAVVALLHAWPLVPALALLRRWSRRRLLGALLLWCAGSYAVMLWRQIEWRPFEPLLALVLEMGLPLGLVALLFMGRATRAIAPWLLLPVTALLALPAASLQLLAAVVAGGAGWAVALVNRLGAPGAVLAFALGAAVLAWWPLRAFGRALGRAYARKRFSDLIVVFGGVWAIPLAFKATEVWASSGPIALVLFLPLLWIPAAFALWPRIAPRRGRPPTLLVLRVFQQDAQVQALFDQVIERWRLAGNTLLIAGTDLVDHTLDADDLFVFLDGRLQQRFVSGPEGVAARLAALDLAPDADGRWRVNECYCHDGTWQPTLQALLATSDVVLMDLRGFQSGNAGCRWELATLAGAARALRVVVLTDGRTALADARQAAAGAAEGRFHWIDATRFDARCRRQVLAALLGA